MFPGLIRQFPNLSHLMRTVYPRSSGLATAAGRAHAHRELSGAIAPSGVASSPASPSVNPCRPGRPERRDRVAVPHVNLRADGRAAVLKSRENLQTLWLRLQLYSSRFGLTFSGDSRIWSPICGRACLTRRYSQSSLLRLPPHPAWASPGTAKSYRLSGITPNDEPDVPVIYETRPWSEDFSGMYPTDKSRAPNETGDFQPYRQYISLDGTVVTMPEKTFQSKILARLAGMILIPVINFRSNGSARPGAEIVCRDSV